MADTYSVTFAPALRSFAAEITAKFASPMRFQPEDQLKGAVVTLLKQAGSALSGITVEAVTEVRIDALQGRPDIGVTVMGLLAGYIELKAPGKGANTQNFKSNDKSQWEKFRYLPNLIYTDGNEWAIYRNGERIGKIVRFSGDITKDGNSAIGPEDITELINLLRDFLLWEPVTPSTPRALAETLAPLCRLLRTEVLGALENPDSNLSALADDWRRYFFTDADNNQFADAYAQTLTYALLLARISGESNLSIPQASKSLRAGHRLLADILNRLGEDDARDEIKVSADLLERVVAAVDPTVFMKSSTTDPWLYFYEDFLAAYDPKMRKDRGVYYTPVEVVQCQVRLVAELLLDRFEADYTFVDRNVVTLDPATGTGTYILAAVQHGLDQIAAIKGKGARVSAATTAARNIHAFELLVGPYTVAHLRLTQQILAENGSLPDDGVHVYLTDTLESPHAVPDEGLPLPYRQLAEEHKRAMRVKRDTPVLVCIGNPPYDRQTIAPDQHRKEHRKGGWIRFGDPTQEKTRRALLDDFLIPLAEHGLSIHAKNLYNDYVYFWRWALWKVFEQKSSPGIVSFITASSYLRGPGFAGMRKVMRETFDDLWIIDLEGDNLGARKSENVFAIQTPVAIAIGVRYGVQNANVPANVQYTRISGSQKEKLGTLNAIQRFKDLSWRGCFSGWLDPFLPSSDTPYWQWPMLTDLFPWQSNGMQFKRSWPIGETREVLERRWIDLLLSKDRKVSFKESRDRLVTKQYPSLQVPHTKDTAIVNLPKNAPFPQIRRIGFRSFDRHWTLLDNRLGDFLRPTLQRTHSEHQVYLTSLLTEVLGEGPAAVVTELIPDLHYFRGSFGGAHVVPLWRDSNGTEPNLTEGVLRVLETAYQEKVHPEEFFSYCYAVLATPKYVASFWDELTIPGPRVPVTKNAVLFKRTSALGRTLIWLHTYGERYVPKGRKKGQVPVGRARIMVGTPTGADQYPQSFSYDSSSHELHIGRGVFAHVRPEVWNFSVSGLQVVKSWLDYRKFSRSGKKSSPLDEIRPGGWQFDDELLELLWVLDATVDLLPEVTMIFDEVLASALFVAEDFPTPTDAERRGPVAESSGELTLFDSDEDEPE